MYHQNTYKVKGDSISAISQVNASAFNSIDEPNESTGPILTKRAEFNSESRY